MDKIQLTGEELNRIGDAIGGLSNEGKFYIDDLFKEEEAEILSLGLRDAADGKITRQKLNAGILRKLNEWQVEATHDTEQIIDHDAQMFDNYLIFHSPSGQQTKLKNRHCLMTGFSFNDNELFDIQ